MNRISQLLTGVLIIAAAGFLGSCKKSFDNPPGPSDPAIAANRTIAQLKALHTSFGAFDVVTEDIIISGIVVADDASGNLYKQLYIQDSSGAIELKLDQAGLYTSYPVGRRIFVKCKGLCVSDYNRMIQLGVKAYPSGAPSLEAIPSGMIGKYVIGGSINNPVVPKVVTLTDLGGSSVDMQNPLLGTLIQLNDFEFVNRNNTYSDTSNYRKDQNDTLQNCSNSRIIMRTSAYSRFAGARVKQGNGSIAAIYTVFQSGSSGTKQLLLRDTTDINFNNLRCGAIAGTVLLSEDFESQVVPATSPYNDVTITGWFNGAEVGSRKFSARTNAGNKYAQATAFGAGSGVSSTAWLVTKGINLGSYATKILKFDTKAGFANGATLKVFVSTNYSGTGNPWGGSATWTDITSQATLSPGLSSGYPTDFTSSGNISLNSYSGTIYIAFKYEGTDPATTTTWQLDNILVVGN